MPRYSCKYIVSMLKIHSRTVYTLIIFFPLQAKTSPTKVHVCGPESEKREELLFAFLMNQELFVDILVATD